MVIPVTPKVALVEQNFNDHVVSCKIMVTLKTSQFTKSESEFMSKAVETLLDILDLERIEQNLYRGESPNVGWQRVFGGQVIGQALVAAQRTVEADRIVHSLHGYFMRPGDPSVPIVYEVDRIRDGKSFTTRRVVAIQHGKAIFSMSASFQILEQGLEHFLPMPEIPDPEKLPSEKQLADQFIDHAPEGVRKYWQRERPIELRRSISNIIFPTRNSSRNRTSGSGQPAHCRRIRRFSRQSLPMRPT